MSTIHLIGGGRDGAELFRRVVADCPGTRPRIATVLVDEGDGATDILRFVGLLSDAGDCDPMPILVPVGTTLDPACLDGADGLFVCGGLTPAYADAITPVAAAVREWLGDDDHVYAGFSAGSAIAAGAALVGGWLLDGVPVCHEDSAEDLDELSVVGGLDLVPFSIDVHCAQWGTLSRLAAAVDRGLMPNGVGIDEDTMLSLRGNTAEVNGSGRLWIVSPANGEVAVRGLTAGARLDVAGLTG